MTGKDRMAAISKSLEENDDSLVRGALDVSRFLTNLTKVEQDRIREQWRRKRMPAECARIDDEAAAAMLQRGARAEAADPDIIAKRLATSESTMNPALAPHGRLTFFQ